MFMPVEILVNNYSKKFLLRYSLYLLVSNKNFWVRKYIFKPVLGTNDYVLRFLVFNVNFKKWGSMVGIH